MPSIAGIAQTRRYYDGPELGQGLMYDMDSTALYSVVEARCALADDKMSREGSPCWWGLAWNFVDSCSYDYIKVRSGNTDFGDVFDRRIMILSVIKKIGGVDSIVDSVTVRKDIAEIRGFNSVALEWRDGDLNVFFGAKTLAKVLSVEMPHPWKSVGKVVGSGDLRVEYAVVETRRNPAVTLASGWSVDALYDHIANSSDAMEGIWSFFDRETDDYRARLGGRYTLACVADGDGGYLLLYVDGAEVNASSWKPCMIKGRLSATQYENNYDLKWFDSVMDPMSDEDFASIDMDANLMTLNFPIHRSKMRFSKKTLRKSL